MDPYLVDAVRAAHAKVETLKRTNADLERDLRFEVGCVYSLRQLLGHSTYLRVTPCDRLKPRPYGGQETTDKDELSLICTNLRERIQKAQEQGRSLSTKLKDVRQERLLLENTYYATPQS